MNYSEYTESVIGSILSRLDRIETRLNAIADELGAMPPKTTAREAHTDVQMAQ